MAAAEAVYHPKDNERMRDAKLGLHKGFHLGGTQEALDSVLFVPKLLRPHLH